MREEYGIEIHTIALDISSSKATAVLEQCSGGASNAFNLSSNDLGGVISQLVKRTLRLTK